ncbi:MAG: DUF1778 domain-containing protein, partial [Pirellulales bacterium]
MILQTSPEIILQPELVWTFRRPLGVHWDNEGEKLAMPETKSCRPSPKTETRISVRVKPDEKALIARAARIKHTTLTEFVLANALHAASQLVAEEKHFEMTPEQFQR